MKAAALIGGGAAAVALYFASRKPEERAVVDAPAAAPQQPGVIGTWLDEISAKVEVMTNTAPRGIRNNNPGNIERTGTQWQGMAPEQTDPRFLQFVSPEYGIRAMARILTNYQRLYGLNTVEQIINRWAPPVVNGKVENDTGAYIRHVADALGVLPNQPIQVQDHLPQLVAMIIKHENGQQPYDAGTIQRGVAMA